MAKQKQDETQIREQRIANLAMSLAEKQIREGTASPSVITHFLKVGSSLADLEREKIERENKLLEAKEKNLIQAADMKDMIENAMDAMSRYRGNDD